MWKSRKSSDLLKIWKEKQFLYFNQTMVAGLCPRNDLLIQMCVVILDRLVAAAYKIILFSSKNYLVYFGFILTILKSHFFSWRNYLVYFMLISTILKSQFFSRRNYIVNSMLKISYKYNSNAQQSCNFPYKGRKV